MGNERLERLRAVMEREGADACLIPSSDFHDSEIVEPYFRGREFLSGFNGSAGTVVVTREHAGLWTDGRYFVQAKKQLEGSGIELMRMGAEGVPTVLEYLSERVPEQGVLAFDGRVVNTLMGSELEDLTKEKGGSVCIDRDFIGEIWENRPELAAPEVWILKEEYAGESAMEKMKRLREEMAKERDTVHVLSSLDDIAWLFNIRKDASDGNLLPPAHVIVTEDQAELFIDSRKFTGETAEYFKKNGVAVRPYEDVYGAVAALRGETVLLEPGKINFALYSRISDSNRLREKMNPTSLMKAMKNPVEMENMRKVHIKDGVALTKFLCWLKKNAGTQPITETEAAERLEEFRMQQEHYLCPSFATISAYGSNAAMCHYHATKEEESPIGAKGFYLVDSGGQYLEGTTDVTRTVALGPVTHKEKLHYTLVLMGMLRLADAKFLYGCRGVNLDYLARGPLWKLGLDFNHGTGHGVGFLANVHERPNGIRWRAVPERQDSCVLEEGMVTSDEPGLYIEGSHGIRTENLLLCRKAEKNEYGQFMRFETLTFAPIDTAALDVSVMEPSDLHLLNEYHRQVYEKISPYLDGEEREWLKEATKEIGGGF